MRSITASRLGLVLGMALAACSGVSAAPDSGAGADNPDFGTGTAADGSTSTDSGVKDPACAGTQLTTSGALDVDLKTVQVSGAVTLNGQTMPDATQYRGLVQFTDRKTGSAVTANLKNSGAATYQLTLVPGTYDVRFVPNSALCSAASNAIPCIGGVLQRGLQLTTSGSVAFDLQSIVVSGAVTLNGGALPGGSDGRGSVVFTSADGSQVDSSVNATSLSSYRLVLLPGTYTASYQPRFVACSQGAGLPCVAGPLRTAFSLMSSGSVPLDLATVNLSGSLKLAGSSITMADQGRGELVLSLRGGGSVTTSAAASGLGLAPFSLPLLKGTYDVSFAPRPALNDCTSPVPCIAGPLQSGLGVTSDGAVTYDLPVITVQGAVTVNGKAPATTENGSLRFALAGGGQVDTRTTGPRRLDNYALKLLPGSYTVSFVGGPGCPTSAAEAPCNSGVVQAGLALTTSGAVPLNVQSVTISGQLKLNGQASSSTAGELVFTSTAAGSSSVGTGAFGSYSVRLIPGLYALDYRPTQLGCAAGTAACVSGRLRSAVMLNSSGTIDQDLVVFPISGAVTLNGQPLPSSDGERGLLQFSSATGSGTTSSFGSSGALTYQMRLLGGSYTVLHQAQPARCANGFSQGGVPCLNQYVAGCP